MTPDAFAVLPVVEYEPPPRSVRVYRPLSHAMSRPHPTPAPGSRRSGQPAVAMAPGLRPAAAFVDAALRRVLEVIDRRRPAAQLGSLLTPGLVDSVSSASRAVAGQDGAAVLRRVRLQAVGPSLTTVEVFGTYSRGRRMHAIAGRVEQVAAAGGTRWQVVALHIG